MTHRSTGTDPRPSPLSTGVLVLSVGTLLSVCDALVHSGEAPARAVELFDALRPMAITTAGTSLAFGLLWLLVVRLAGRRLRAAEGPLTYALVGCVVSAYVLEFFSVRPRAGILAVALPYGALVGLAARRWWSSAWRRSVGTVAFCMPTGALAGLAAIWVHKVAVDAGGGSTTAIRAGWAQWAAMTGAWVVVAGLLALLGRRRRVLLHTAVGMIASITIIAALVAPALERHHAARQRQAAAGGNAVPHVILIVVDALRPDALSCYGNQDVETPAFDRLAGDGVLFERALAPAPWTVPSMASVLTGVSPWVHRATAASREIPDKIPTLAERMSTAGYVTAGIGRNKFLCRGRFERGYGHFDFFPRRRIDVPVADTLGLLWRRDELTGTTADITDRAGDWLEAHRGVDAFLWLHVFDPHMPYEPGPEFRPEGRMPGRIGPRFGSVRAVRAGRFVPPPREKRWIHGLYQGEVRLVDAHLDRLLTRQDQLDMYDDALIVLTSDHGEEFWEHGGWEHGHTLYDELLHVPLVVKLPGATRVGRVATPVALGSLMPTILELCQLDPSDSPLSFASIAPLLTGQGAETEPPAIFATGQLYYEPQDAVMFEGFKYIRAQHEDRSELFDLRVDPGEEVDVAGTHPWEVARAEKLLDGYELSERALRKRIGASESEAPLDADTEEHLRSLGYIE